MFRWVRPVIIVLALLAILAGGRAVASAGQLIPECDDMTAHMVMDDCVLGDSDEGGTVPGCPQLACVSAQIVLPLPGSFDFPTVMLFIPASPPHDDLERAGFSGPPDLRPPIA